MFNPHNDLRGRSFYFSSKLYIITVENGEDTEASAGFPACSQERPAGTHRVGWGCCSVGPPGPRGLGPSRSTGVFPGSFSSAVVSGSACVRHCLCSCVSLPPSSPSSWNCVSSRGNRPQARHPVLSSWPSCSSGFSWTIGRGHPVPHHCIHVLMNSDLKDCKRGWWGWYPMSLHDCQCLRVEPDFL